MHGMASHTGTSGSATDPPMKRRAIGERKNICIRYIPKVSFDRPEMNFGVVLRLMQEKSRKAPNEAISTLGIQNSQAHSRVGVSMGPPGTPLYQKAHPVKAAPMNQQMLPTMSLRRRDQFRWYLM